MYNKYTVTITTETIPGSPPDFKEEILARADLYIVGEKGLDWGIPFGRLYKLNNSLNTKQDFLELFTAISNTVYGQEEKAKDKESNS